MKTRSRDPIKDCSGFSLLELIIAMTIALAMMAAASTLLATSLRIRARENTRSAALNAAQRALNIMSREIGNSGYGLNDNGIVINDTSTQSIRIRADLNNDYALSLPAEDIRYVFQGSPNFCVVRFDIPAPAAQQLTVLANDISNLTFKYYDANDLETANYANAEKIRIDVTVNLPATTGQPASVVHLQSDVALRNANVTLKRF